MAPLITFVSKFPASRNPRPCVYSPCVKVALMSSPMVAKGTTLSTVPRFVHHLFLPLQVLEEPLTIPLWCQRFRNYSIIRTNGRMNIKDVRETRWLEYILKTSFVLIKIHPFCFNSLESLSNILAIRLLELFLDTISWSIHAIKQQHFLSKICKYSHQVQQVKITSNLMSIQIRLFH